MDASERTEAGLARKVEWVRQAAGERFESLELNILIGDVVLTEDRQQAAEQYVRERARPGATAELLLASPYLFFGTVDQIAEQMQRLREQFGISYFVVGDESMEVLAQVVARLAGT